MASVGEMNITVKINTSDLSVALRMIAFPASTYLWCLNLYRKITGRKMTTLKIKIEETEV